MSPSDERTWTRAVALLRSHPFLVAAPLAGAVLLAFAARAMLRLAPPAGADPVRVHREDLVTTVEVEGELAAVRAIEIGAPPIRNVWDYKISFLAAESKPVKKGEPVIGFDTQQLLKSLEEKTAELAEATKQIERREIDLAIQVRDLELLLAEAEARLSKALLKNDVPEGLMGRIETMQARLELRDAEKEAANLRAKLTATRATGEADLRSLRSRRDRASGRVDELKDAIDRMTVKAPLDGVVIYKTGWDNKKKVGDSTWVGEKVLELPDLTEMKAKGQVDEADAGRVAVGQKVTLRLESRPDLDFTGVVRAIGRSVLRKSRRIATKVYRIEVALDRTDPVVMRPAMRFRGDIETGRHASLLVAPREAILLRPYGPAVWVKRGMKWEEVPLTLGRSNKRLVEVVAGLSEGDLLSPVDLRPPEKGRPRGPMAAGL